jgi:hypothetical protein
MRHDTLWRYIPRDKARYQTGWMAGSFWSIVIHRFGLWWVMTWDVKRTPYLGTLVLTTINLDYYIYHDRLWLVNGPAIDGRVSERETNSLSYFHRAFWQARPLITTAPPWRSSDHYSLALSQRERPRGPCLAALLDKLGKEPQFGNCSPQPGWPRSISPKR